NKPYDGNTTATLTTTGYSLIGIISPDVVTLDADSYTANFDTKDIGNAKPVTVSDLALSGADAGNYTLIQPTGLTANITSIALTVTGINANNKPYDGNTTAILTTTGYSLVGIISPDVVTLYAGSYTADFDNKNVGNAKPVSVSGLALSGADAGNYTLTQPTGLTANITAIALTVTGITANNKPYDGNTTATLTTTGYSLVGIISPDVVTLDAGSYTANFDTKEVGNAKPVTVSGLALSGADAGNYTLTQPTGMTANITAIALTVTGITANNKPYDGTTTAMLTTAGYSLLGIISPDVVTLDAGSYTANFDTKDVGNTKPVTVSGLSLSGTDAGNYTLTQPTGLTANITSIALTVTGITPDNKPYDGNTTATLTTTSYSLVGIISPDVVTLDAGSYTANFDTKDVGNAKPVTVSGLSLSGADAGNYTLTQPTGLTANITAIALTITGITPDNKPYDGNTTATLTTTGSSLVGIISPDVVTLDAGSYTANFNTKDVGNAKPVTVSGLSLSGTNAGNYTLTQPTGLTANITAATSLTWTGNTDSDWNTASNWSPLQVPSATTSLVIPNVTNNPVIGTTGNECNNLTINSGAIVTINENNDLTVIGTLTNSAGNSGLIIKSDVTGTGSLIHSTAGVNATVERYIAGWSDINHGWHLIASPVSSQTIDPNFIDPTPANYDFFKWDETAGNLPWINYKNGGFTTFNIGQGYSCGYRTTDTKNFTGTLNNASTSTINLTRTEANNFSGWNLLGNPFPSAIQWNKDTTSWRLTNITRTAKIWNEANASYSDVSQNGIIPAMQGFMVEVPSGISGSLVIPAVDKVHDAQGWYKNTETNRLMLVAHDPTGQTAQESIIRFKEDATEGFDIDYDAHFFTGYAPQFYSVSGDDHLSTNTISFTMKDNTIPMGFVKNDNTSFSIEAKGLETFTAGTEIWLQDLKTGTQQKLNDNPVYYFISTSGDEANRFKVKFGGTFSINEPSVSPFNIYAGNGIVYVNNNGNQTVKGTITVYSITGQLIATRSLTGDRLQKIDFNGKPGCYVVKITTDQSIYLQKVIIN
ncbi:MAG: YDG domain-containing protein, partial [Bacteroidales bacterium]|nr:YDG domain-containing protein [Bacteroidales bacterium]